MDEVEHSRSRVTHAATEMNFGLREDDRNHHDAPHAVTEMNFGLREDDCNHHGAPHVATKMMVLIIRSSPRRRASPRVAEGFRPTAQGVDRIKFSISIISVYTPLAAGASRDMADRNNGQCI